ncbi:MAG: adenylyl-sulfate kinase [Verrucomicrobiales bacterium]|nr:adenylyl-sulfate kinase [Verrucomicrobiales bacterium]
MCNPDNIYTTFDEMLPREAKEALLGQKGFVIWLYGLSGSGKSTLAFLLERHLHNEKKLVKVLDGDNIRSALNQDLGFSDNDRKENIRRVAEVAKLFADTGVITIASFITPNNELRTLARDIIGADDFFEVYVKASYQACNERDPKGIYARADAGMVESFTGKRSGFEEPEEGVDLVIDTEVLTESESIDRLIEALKQHPHFQK